MSDLPVMPDSVFADEPGVYCWVPRLATLEESLDSHGGVEEKEVVRELYVRHVPPPPIDERHDCEPICSRDERGRFQRVWWWMECPADHPDAQPALAIKGRIA